MNSIVTDSNGVPITGHYRAITGSVVVDDDVEYARYRSAKLMLDRIERLEQQVETLTRAIAGLVELS